MARPQVPTHPLEFRQWVITQLRLNGYSLASIAKAEGVSPQAVSHALSNPSERLENALAAALGMTVEQLFPWRFKDGVRLHSTRGQGTKSRTDVAVRNGAAA